MGKTFMSLCCSLSDLMSGLNRIYQLSRAAEGCYFHFNSWQVKQPAYGQPALPGSHCFSRGNSIGCTSSLSAEQPSQLALG